MHKRSVDNAVKASKPVALATVVLDLIWIGQAAIVAYFFQGLVMSTISGQLVIWLAALFLIAGTFRAWLGYVTTQRLERIADGLAANLREDILSKQDVISPYASSRKSSAEVASLLLDKIEFIRPFLLRYQSAFMRARIVPIVIIILAAKISWAAAFVFLIAGPVIPVFMALIGIKAKAASERQIEEIGTMNSLLLERLQALSDIRLLNARDNMIVQFTNVAEKLKDDTMRVLRIAFLSSTVLELFAAIGVAMIAVYVGFSLLGEIGFGAYASGLTLGEGVFLLLLAPAYFQPLRDVASAWHDKVSANAVIAEIDEVLTDASPSIVGEGDLGNALKADKIETRGLAIVQGETVLRFPDLQLSAGGFHLLRGRSGVGKSTLLGLLGGLIAPSEGEILADDRALSDADFDVLRGAISWVPQHPHFFQMSLRENLTRGLDVQDDDLQNALSRAGASDVIARLGDGLDTMIGENGGGLSGGEARRLMIARAILEARPFVLADEPTADLDNDAADLVMASLLDMQKSGAAIVVASHDPRLFPHAQTTLDLEAT